MFRVEELLKATAGRLISARKSTLIRGISIDSRKIKKGEAFIAIKGENFDGHNFIDAAIKKGASCIIQKSPKSPKSPGVVFIEVKDTLKALGDIARYQRSKFGIPIIAITGSNGKTIAKEMVAWILSNKFKVLKNEGTKNNQIGLPLTLLNLNRNYDIAVLELGTNHFGEIEYLARICLPNIGIITNIGPAHLEYFHNLKGVLREKCALTENLKNPYLAILNSDDNLLRSELVKRLKRPFILSFGIEKEADFNASQIRFLAKKFDTFAASKPHPLAPSEVEGSGYAKFTPLSINPERNSGLRGWENRRVEFLVNKKYKFTLKTLGYHNIYNALAAIGIARIFGIEYKEAARRLTLFEFPPGRLKAERLNKINFIDDTYNSNPFSLEQALETLANFRIKGRKIFVMGDMLELGNRRETFHSRAGENASQVCDVFITVGKLSELAASAAKSFGFNAKNIFTCESPQQARDILFNKVSACADDLVLVKGSRAMKMEEILKS